MVPDPDGRAQRVCPSAFAFATRFRRLRRRPPASSKGRTADFGSAYWGSNPYAGTDQEDQSRLTGAFGPAKVVGPHWKRPSRPRQVEDAEISRRGHGARLSGPRRDRVCSPRACAPLPAERAGVRSDRSAPSAVLGALSRAGLRIGVARLEEPDRDAQARGADARLAVRCPACRARGASIRERRPDRADDEGWGA